MMDDDAQLLRRYAREGAEEAFAEIVRRHLGLVYGSALRRMNGNAALAEEVAQGIFARVAREAAELEKKAETGMALAGWLYVATKHAAANVVRAEARRVRREQEAFAMSNTAMNGCLGGTAGAGGDACASEAEVWAQVRPELETVMDELGAADRDAVLLRFFEGRAFGEIGAALRVSEDAARVRVNRALEKMRGLLAKRGVTSTAAALGGLLAGNAAVAAPAGLAASVTGAALAGGVAVVAAGSAAVGAGVLTFMTTTKIVTGVACVVAAVAVGTAVSQHRSQQAAQAEVVRLADDARLTRRIDESQRSRRETERKTLRQVPAPTAGEAAKATEGRAEWQGKIDQMLAYTVSQTLDQSCNDFFTRNPVDAATRKKAINVLTDETLAGMDIGLLSQREGGLTQESISQLLAEGRAKTAEQLKEILGLERGTAFLEFIAAREAQAEATKSVIDR